MGLYEGSSPVLYHNYVEHLSNTNVPVQGQVYIALAGPIISFLQAGISGFIYIKSPGRRLIDLFWLWFAILGFNNAIGYLLTGPIFKAGDIGKTYQLLETPVTLQIVLALIAALMLVFMAYKLTGPFLKFCPVEEWGNSGKLRKKFLFYILIVPWLVGSAVITVLYLPVIAWISIIYPFMSGMIFIFPWQNADSVQNTSPSRSKSLQKLSMPALWIMIILIALFKGILVMGVNLSENL
jgi:hypothetical protein